MKKKPGSLLLSALLLLSASSCSQSVSGKIIFELEGGQFTDPAFATTVLTGQAGTALYTSEIPDPVLEGYYFVGWREKNADGSYRTINQRMDKEGRSYYVYPYGTDTFYAYFEPLVTITFDLGEGKDYGTLIAPKYESNNFSGNVLSGYASKEIADTEYLPTVDATIVHLNFQYWYTQYPLVSETDENKNEHYHIDTTQEQGIYRFDKSFKSNMEFPIDSNVTLYAYYESDPTITIYYNLDGFEPFSFQAKDNITEELSSLMNQTFGFDFETESDHYYYPSDTKKKRFAGFFLDEGFTEQFFLDSQISSKDFSLYLKWENQVNVTFDYQGGTLNGETSHTIEGTYYENDVLGEELLSQYTPARSDAEFLNYQLDGALFSFARTRLPDHDITLLATYSMYPTLTLSFDYPDGFDGTEIEPYSTTLAIGSELDSYIDNFKSNIEDDTLVITDTYLLSENGEKESFLFTTMPEESLSVYFQIDYKAKVSISTYVGSETTYALADDIETYESYFEITENGEDCSLDLDDFSSIQDSIALDSVTYLYDDIYFDTDFTQKVTFPIYEESSHTERTVLSLYRKMTKAVTLSFYDYDTETDLSLSLQILPHHSLSDYEDQIKAVVGNYSALYIQDEGEIKQILTLLPSNDSVIFVKR